MQKNADLDTRVSVFLCPESLAEAWKAFPPVLWVQPGTDNGKTPFGVENHSRTLKKGRKAGYNETSCLHIGCAPGAAKGGKTHEEMDGAAAACLPAVLGRRWGGGDGGGAGGDGGGAGDAEYI